MSWNIDIKKETPVEAFSCELFSKTPPSYHVCVAEIFHLGFLIEFWMRFWRIFKFLIILNYFLGFKNYV